MRDIQLMAALLACRREARRERTDYRVIVRIVDEAIGREPAAPWDPLAATKAVVRIRDVVDTCETGGTVLGARLVEIGRVCDETLAGQVPEARCADCGRPYTDPGFADLVVEEDVWAKVAPHPDGSGLLCPSCLIGRAARAGVVCEGELRSGPVSLSTRSIEREAVTAELVAAARRAADVFRRYATLHDEKGTAEGRVKSEANVAEAEAIEWVLERVVQPGLGGYPPHYTGDH